ncbi:MAG: YceI family protein [Pseudomonadota bacterium]|uniref:YceI family protein n=1 Tax=Fodinicurvata fenggangensis TaxID=1121830 RepID=UPI0004791E9D|nr:YceI family protein [Fodinicurvata fenggangensis]
MRNLKSATLPVTAMAAFAATAAFSLDALAAPEEYKLDPAHTYVVFKVDHIGYSQAIGRFNEVEGSFVFDEEEPSISDLNVTIQAESVDTNHEERDEHLRSGDFLDVENHPEITFVMTGSEQTDDRTGKIMGDLTILDTTREVTLDVTWNASKPYPFGENYVTGASASTSINRSDFGMNYGVEGGMIGDSVDIEIEIEAIRQ